MNEATDLTGQPRRTQPLGLVIGALQGLRSAVFSLAALWFVTRDDLGGVSWAIYAFAGMALLAIGFSFFFSWLAWTRRTYTTGRDDIRVESGIVSRQARSVPYDRIQDVSLEQALLPRLFGLVSVKFETGAGGKEELSLSYLTEAEGEELRSTVRAMKAGAGSVPVAADGEAAEAPEEEEARTLFAMGPGRLLTFGVFEFSLAFVAVLFGVTQQFEFLLPFDVWDPDVWMGWVNEGSERLGGLGPMAQFAGFLAAAVSLILTGLAAGIGKTFLRDWDFKLEDTPRGLRRRRGLLTKTDVMMPLHRVQAIIVSTGIVRRLFGWHGLKLVSLAQDSGNASHDVVPFGRMPEIAPVADVTGFALAGEDTSWHRSSRESRIDGAILAIAIALPISIAIGLALHFLPDVSVKGRVAALPLFFGVLVAAREYFLWRYERHAIDAAQVYTRTGWLAPKLVVGNRVKLQSVEIAQGPIARLRGYATLHCGLAGGKFAIENLPLARARAVREELLASMCATDFADTRKAS
ncbi:PH domain-containing protein [Paraurantiacibacter namhicola]|uniref:Bacterial membrane flanked domain protein n=1 Tax=Paraurantiacibacter namhicola TaxID=645517 RepID=A0A1C7D5T4_9SPHN|nr:PH domain-containing protein [Paraurantiacibacter namhicola]ANU06663.1 Bacterial membrane flanked domain protein [Paraurantiacibacter namhicola]